MLDRVQIRAVRSQKAVAHRSAMMREPLARPPKAATPSNWDAQNSRHFHHSHDSALGSFSSDQNPFGSAGLSPQQSVLADSTCPTVCQWLTTCSSDHHGAVWKSSLTYAEQWAASPSVKISSGQDQRCVNHESGHQQGLSSPLCFNEGRCCPLNTEGNYP